MWPQARWILLTLTGSLSVACAVTPCREPGAPPPFQSSKPVKVVATVDQFRHRGAWIDFEQDFVAYDSIVFTVAKPNRHAWTRLFVQYQGLPTVNGRRIELGDVLTFTVQLSGDSECCEPYLEDLDDIQFVESEEGGGDG